MKETRTIKIWLDTYLKLKRLAARKPEKIVELIDRLVDEELARKDGEPLVGLEPTT